MTRLEYSIAIDADRTLVWQALWNDASYREWARVFFEGSFLVADSWEVGGHVHFLSADGSGIYSVIEDYVANHLVRFRHVGAVVNGEEQPVDEDSRVWTGATEVYRLSKGGEFCTLTIEVDVMDEHLPLMSDRLPQALERIRTIALGSSE